jgi:hypothetical protein
MGFQSGGTGVAVEARLSEGVRCPSSMRLGLGTQSSVWHVGWWLGVEADEEDALGRGVFNCNTRVPCSHSRRTISAVLHTALNTPLSRTCRQLPVLLLRQMDVTN